MYKYLFKSVKRIIPKISETEIIALKSGGTSIDRNFFICALDYQKILTPIIPKPNYELLYQDIIKVGEYPI
jgi:hypothetical protein